MERLRSDPSGQLTLGGKQFRFDILPSPGAPGIEVEKEWKRGTIKQKMIQNTFGSGVAVRQRAFAVLTNNIDPE